MSYEAKVEPGSHLNRDTEDAINQLTKQKQKAIYVEVDRSLYDDFKMKMIANKQLVMADVIRRLMVGYVGKN